MCCLHAQKGSGGLEIHYTSPSSPFDMRGGELIDIDAVFKREYDQTTFDLFVGCGGCVFSVDAVVIPPVQLSGYEPGELEPFSQSWYFSVFPKSARKFNTSELLYCDQDHFGIFVKDYHNRSNGEELVWAAVVGLGERFTFTELLSFPIFEVRNHGNAWNGMGHTIWINFIILSPMVIFIVRTLLYHLGVPVLGLDLKRGLEKGQVTISGDFNLREFFYAIAIVGFVGTILEQFWHLMYAQFQPGVPVGPMLFVGIVGVITIPNGWGIAQTLLAWASMKNDNDPLCGTRCMRCSGNAFWAPVEILSGFSMLFIFGAGMYLGPACVMAAGVVRLLELLYKVAPTNSVVVYSVLPVAPSLMLRR